MLTSLSIRDVVLIETLDLEFGPGLAVLTGETGAGISILLDSLGLALGARLATKSRTREDVSSVFRMMPLAMKVAARKVIPSRRQEKTK